MFHKTVCLFSLVLFITMSLDSQNLWTNYVVNKSVNCINSIENDIWVGTDGGLLRFNNQNNDLTFYTKANSKLPGIIVYSIAIDRHNTIWVGTNNGLLKISDSTWTVFNTQNSNIPGNNVYKIAFDTQNTLWLITRYNGAAYLDEHQFVIFKTSNSDIPTNHLLSLAIDSTNNVWIGTYAAGLARYTNSGEWIHYTTDNSELLSNFIKTIHVNEGYKIYVGSSTWAFQDGGMNIIEQGNWSSYSTNNSGIESKDINCITTDDSNFVWIAHTNGLNRFDGSNWQHYTPENSGLTQQYLKTCYFTEDQILYLGSYWGLESKDHENWEQYDISYCDLASNTIFDIESDNDSNVWLCTLDGLNIIHNNDQWVTYNESNSPLEKAIHSVEPISIDYFWVACRQEQVLKYINDNWTVFDYNDIGIYDYDFIYDIEIDYNGNIWIGCNSDYGLLKYDHSSWQKYTDIPIEWVMDIEIDTTNALWIADVHQGLFYIQDENWQLFNTSNSGLPSNNLFCVEIDEANNIWCGTLEGIGVFNGNEWIIWNEANSLLPDNYIHDIEFQKNIAWIATDNGAVRINGDDWRIFNVNNSPLTADEITSISIDNNNNIWFAGHGLTRFEDTTFINIRELKPKYTVKAYPNPCTNTICIELNDKFPKTYEVCIYDIRGQKISNYFKCEQYNNFSFCLDINDLSSGIYLITIQCDKYSITKKIIKY